MILQWTSTKPAKAGYYWVRAEGVAGGQRILEFQKSDGGYPEDHPLEPVDGPYSTEGWKEFAGPIPEPK